MILWHLLRFICRLMFLIYYYKPKITKWSKKSWTRTYYNIKLSVSCPFKLIKFFTRWKSRIHNWYSVSKVTIKSHQGLIGQWDFRNQNYRLLATLYDLFDHTNIDFSFTASCDPMKQIGLPDIVIIIIHDLINYVLLLIRKIQLLCCYFTYVYRIPVIFFFCYAYNAFILKASDRSSRNVEFTCYKLIRYPFTRLRQKLRKEPFLRFPVFGLAFIEILSSLTLSHF